VFDQPSADLLGQGVRGVLTPDAGGSEDGDGGGELEEGCKAFHEFEHDFQDQTRLSRTDVIQLKSSRHARFPSHLIRRIGALLRKLQASMALQGRQVLDTTGAHRAFQDPSQVA
jgi:hypothetical protein